MNPLIVLLLLGSMPMFAAAAERLAVVTIVEGELILTRDASRYLLAEGARLQADDIVQTVATAKLARLEFADGKSIDLGPGTRLWLGPRFAERGASRAAGVYMLDGWVKISTPKGGPDILASPNLDITAVGRDLVLALAPTAASVFAETGTAELTERSRGKPTANLKLAAGDFYSRAGEAKSSVATRPSADFVQRVPRPFLDTLPSRAPLFASKDVAPKLLAPVSYAEVQDWIDGEPSIRPAFLARWKPLARQPEFRKGLLANERAHPEWDRVLHPEKYLPKPRPPASGAAPGPTDAARMARPAMPAATPSTSPSNTPPAYPTQTPVPR